jgi:hypothetical protein
MEIIVCLNRIFFLCELHEQNKTSLLLLSLINNNGSRLCYIL